MDNLTDSNLNVKIEDGIDYSRQWVRSFLFVALAFVIVFIFIDKLQIPEEAFPVYLWNRILFQALPISIGICLTFIKDYTKIYQPTLFIISSLVSISNIYVIAKIWEVSSFAFDFEGLMLYLVFYFFIARMSFKFAVIHAAIVIMSFVLLVVSYPIYGEKGAVYIGFVVSSYIIALIGVYKLQLVLEEKYQYSLRLLELSNTDQLTNLFNRKGYEDNANLQLSLGRRNQQNVSLLIFDIDHFKEFNDNYGHIKGDKILQLKAKILKSIFLRDSDVLARYGGDEYVVLTAGTSATDVEILANKVIKKWKEQRVHSMYRGKDVFINCSIGAYTKIPSNEDDLETFFKAADKALYQAKAKGRACIVSLDGN